VLGSLNSIIIDIGLFIIRRHGTLNVRFVRFGMEV